MSADAVALALAARTAATLALANQQLLTHAIEAVDEMAKRSPDIVPELHLALAVWAIDELVIDRDRAPWPTIRERLERGSVYGVDAALRSYAAAVAARHFDARGLVQELIARAPASPAVTDGSVVLWLLAVAIDRMAVSMKSDEPALAALIERRAALTERLAVELDDEAFQAPRAEGLTADAPLGLEGSPVYLSPMEALLLDISLAPSDSEPPWLSFPQARALFGQRAAEEYRQVVRMQRRLAWSVAVAAVIAGAMVSFGLLLAEVAAPAATAWGAAATFAVLAGACAIAHAVAENRLVTGAMGSAAVTASLCAVVNAINLMLPTPLLPDAAGVIAGAGLTAVAALIWVIAVEQMRSGRPARRPDAEP